MVILSDDRRFVDANPAACRLLAVDPVSRLIGRRVDDFVLPALGNRITSDWVLPRSEGNNDGEYEMRRDDGERRTVAYTTTPHITPGYHLAILRDITENKKRDERRTRELEALTARYEQLAEKLRSTKAESRLIFEHNPLPMLVYKRDALRIVDVNAAFVSGYGYSRAEALSLSVTDLVPWEDVEPLVAFLDAHPGGVQPSPTGGFPSQSWRHCYKDGTTIDVEVTTANLVLRGLDCRLALCQNVTERYLAAADLAAARNSAIAALTVKSAFLAHMSHEMRTPMNGVIGTNELMLETDLTEEQRSYVEQVARCGEEMMGIIDDILDVSKIGAGEIMLEHVGFDLRDTVEQACAAAGRGARAKGIDFEIDIAADVPRDVIGDRKRLRQVLLNLVENAVKFTEEGTVGVRVSATGRWGDTTAIRCEVADTGIGIDPAVLQRMFDPFTQADASTTRHYGGTGLGLTIARALVELMGGTIGAESHVGRGSTFWFELELFSLSAMGEGDEDGH